MHVEVKGTTGLGLKVILPKNEVHHAQCYEHVALAVAYGVSLKKGKVPKATGGELRVMHPGFRKFVDKDLEPLAYYYEDAVQRSRLRGRHSAKPAFPLFIGAAVLLE